MINLFYIKLVLIKFINLAAKLNGYNDIGAMWRSAYDNNNFNLNDEVEMCYQQIKPFYQQVYKIKRINNFIICLLYYSCMRIFDQD